MFAESCESNEEMEILAAGIPASRIGIKIKEEENPSLVETNFVDLSFEL